MADGSVERAIADAQSDVLSEARPSDIRARSRLIALEFRIISMDKLGDFISRQKWLKPVETILGTVADTLFLKDAPFGRKGKKFSSRHLVRASVASRNYRCSSRRLDGGNGTRCL